MDARPGRGLWVAWALALAGGVAVVVAAVVLARMDLGTVCRGGSACAGGLPSSVAVLAFGGTGVAIVGGLTATVLAAGRLSGRGGSDGGDGHAGRGRSSTGTHVEHG